MPGENRKKRRKIWFEERDSHPGKVLYPDGFAKVRAIGWSSFVIDTMVTKAENNNIMVRTSCGQDKTEEVVTPALRDATIAIQQGRIDIALEKRLERAGIPIPAGSYKVDYQVNGQT